jgi:hypothetical protein
MTGPTHIKNTITIHLTTVAMINLTQTTAHRITVDSKNSSPTIFGCKVIVMTTTRTTKQQEIMEILVEIKDIHRNIFIVAAYRHRITLGTMAISEMILLINTSIGKIRAIEILWNGQQPAAMPQLSANNQDVQAGPGARKREKRNSSWVKTVSGLYYFFFENACKETIGVWRP